jgi:hypothetical protein
MDHLNKYFLKGRPVKYPCLCLVGEPDVGKTRIIEYLFSRFLSAHQIFYPAKFKGDDVKLAFQSYVKGAYGVLVDNEFNVDHYPFDMWKIATEGVPLFTLLYYLHY